MTSPWRKPSRSMSNGACAEVSAAPGTVAVRDTKQAGQPGRTELRFPASAWTAYVNRLKGQNQ